MTNLAGGCLCGRVRYTVSGDPVFSGVCHCRSCQRFTGSAFEAVIAFPNPAISAQGELKTYDDTGDSGKQVHRKFCPNCGSGVMTEVDVMPGMTLILSGSLDDPSSFTPTMEIYCDSAQPWVHGGGERQRFPKMPG
jgi:hypothetical protein